MLKLEAQSVENNKIETLNMCFLFGETGIFFYDELGAAVGSGVARGIDGRRKPRRQAQAEAGDAGPR